MTKRQRDLLKQAQADIAAGKRWDERGLSAYPGGAQMTWDEMQWLGEQIAALSVAAIGVVLEARDIIERTAPPLGWARDKADALGR